MTYDFQPGKRLGEYFFIFREDGEFITKSTSDLFGGKRVIIFSLPGAFTPTCSNYQLPGFDDLYDEFKNQGIDEIFCVSVNDGFVMNAWGESLGIENVKLIPDGNADFTDYMDMLVGNHDIYYKNTLRINAPSELLGGYDNIRVHDVPTTVNFDNLPILLLPWICDENRERSLNAVAESDAPICMGHLELNGFEAHPGHVMLNGMDKAMFKKFKRVFSGHYHMKSKKDNVTYLGNPYQLYWNDYGCKRGFHVFDTDTLRTTFYRNPFDIFHKLYYNDGIVLPDSKELEGTFVKLIVEDKGDYAKFYHNIKQIQEMSLGDLKIIEDLSSEVEGSSVLETEDTMTLLDNYIDEIDLKVDKSNVKSVMRSLYTEALEL